MNSEPPPIPTIARGPLWIVLSIPPIFTLLVNLCIKFTSGNGEYGSNYLLTPMVIGVLILVLIPFFHRIVGSRYRGRSLVFLNFAYLLGQMMVCLAVWFGSCLLLIG